MIKPENLKPTNSRVLLKILDNISEYDGIVSVLDDTKEKSDLAEVISISESTNICNISNKVIFHRNSGTRVLYDRFDTKAPEYRLIKEEDILAIINDN